MFNNKHAIPAEMNEAKSLILVEILKEISSKKPTKKIINDDTQILNKIL